MSVSAQRPVKCIVMSISNLTFIAVNYIFFSFTPFVILPLPTPMYTFFKAL